MHRLLIVDDEPIIVDGLYEHLREVRGETLELYRAYGSAEAQAIADRLRVDVLVTDIRMPGADGLELVTRLRTRWPRCRVIYLTGYDDFPSIYAATRSPGVTYLLKTEGYERIVQAVDRHVAEIEEAYRDQGALEQARRLVRDVLPRLREEHLAGLLDGGLPATDGSGFDALGIGLDSSAPVHLALGFHCPGYGETTTEVRTAARLEAERIGGELGPAAAAHLRDALALVIQPTDPDPTGARLRSTLEILAKRIEAGTGAGMGFLAFAAALPWSAVSAACAELRRTWYHRSDHVPGATLEVRATGDVHERGLAAARLKSVLARLADLEILLDRGDQDAFHASLDRLWLTAAGPVQAYPDLGSQLEAGVSLFLLSYLRAAELDHQLSPDLVRPLEHPGVGGPRLEPAIYHRVADAVFDLGRAEREGRVRAAVERVKKHVREHLDEDLSLERMADVAFFCPKYLSRVFKQVTDTGYLEFVNARRLERAKELLAKREWKINRVGAAVGYRTAPYFTRFFKRLTGSTPQEYRDELARKEGEQG